MRAFLSVFAAFVVMGLAFWAYRENYATKAVIDEVARLERAISEEREVLSVLNAEWAYLNRPDRLRDLAELNFERLQLMPILPEQFGSSTEVTYPVSPFVLGLGESVDVSSQSEEGE